ncbi:MAG: ABC transporter ATP-binding protein [Acidimicrobiales bacterium]|nr:ABC transporter ATP-binding protein [Acidimicrobiales bacterium]
MGDISNTSIANEPLLVVDDLKTHFRLKAGDVKAVDGVSLTLDRGKTLGVVGESGSGKTVLARTIMGLNLGANVQTSGSVLYQGREILGLKAKQMRNYWGREISMVFQDPMTSLNPVVKIGRQVTEHLRHHLDMDKDEANEVALQLLREVRIPEAKERLDSYPHQLSGGMRQRVSIAIALACGPKLLFADEPTTALDVTVQHQIMNLLAREQNDRDMAMILVTHDLGVVAGRTDEIAVMYAGRVVERARTRDLFADVKMPYTEALLRSIPRTTQRNHTRLAAIPGRPPDLINPPKGCAFAPRCAYAQDICHEEMPQLREAGPGHQFRCHFPVGSPEGLKAFQDNLAAGLPQAVSIKLHADSVAEQEGAA